MFCSRLKIDTRYDVAHAYSVPYYCQYSCHAIVMAVGSRVFAAMIVMDDE